MLAVLRFLRRVPPPRVGRDEAVRLAADELHRNSWKLEPNAPVIEHLREWEVWARNARLCSNMVVRVDMQDGSAKAYTERGLLSGAGEGSSSDSGGQ